MREYALVFLVTATVTYLLTPVFRRLAARAGAMAEVRDRDVHVIPTPYGGGLAMYVGMIAGLFLATKLPLLSLISEQYDDAKAVALAGGVIVIVGLIDDRWPLDALTKLAGQILASGVLVMSGVRLSTLSIPGTSENISFTPDVSVPLTVLLCVVLINAVNFIDGLDGLAAGVVAIAALASFAFSYQLATDQRLLAAQPSALVACVLIGACLGFLPHNFHPARVFMGDSGSMLIGLTLAACTTSVTSEVDYASAGLSQQLPFFVPIVLPAVVLAIPFLDLLLAVVRRTRAGRSPFAPDKMHLHHRLLEIGHSHRRAVILMYAWVGLLAGGGVLVSVSQGLALPLTVLSATGFVVLVVSVRPRLRAGALSDGA
jgi:UDP-GlcNAc:undecaprenyl-phosphate GlcNAc-1-phosphate transferase